MMQGKSVCYADGMWIVYVIQHNMTKELYFGCTNNLKKRIDMHNKNRGGYTKRKSGTWMLVYAEAYRDKYDAFVRESRLKDDGNAKRELKRRITGSLEPKVVRD